MKSKGTQTMQKIVIKKPWGVEIKDYKAGDPIPAGVKFKIFDAKDTAKIEAYVDSLDESADYQKKRFKEPAYMYESVSKKNIKSADDLYEWLTEYMRKHSSNRFTTLQIILGNGNNITFAWDMKANKGIHEGDKDYTMSEFVYKFMDPVIKNSGISDIWEVDMETGRFKPTKESLSSKTHKFKPEELKVGKRVIDKVGGHEVHGKITVNHHDLYKDNPYTQDKKGSTVVTITTDKGRSYDVDANDNGGEFILESKKAIKEAYLLVDTDTNNKPVYFHWGKYSGIDWWDDKKMASRFSTKEQAERWIEKMRQEGAIVKDMKVIEEGRIARGYENLDADERAKHLLSHPSSKYMSDLKSENITERAIRKAVKEMLAQPDKRDPQFITDVNEEGEAPAIANTTAEVANPELPLKLKEDKIDDLMKTAYRIYKKNAGRKSYDDWYDEILNPYSGTYGSEEEYLKAQGLLEDAEELENSIKYQTSVAGGMGTDAENAESAQEYEDKTSLIKEHKSFRKFLKESH